MSWFYYDIYADESGTNGGEHFYFGALSCSPARAAILTKELTSIKDKFECDAEMKWTKASKKMLPMYKSFVDVFLTAKHVRYTVMEVSKTIHWHSFGKTNRERFLKCYYNLLISMMGYNCRYRIFIDYLEGKSYQWSTLQFFLNKKLGVYDSYPREQKRVPCLMPLDSKSSVLLQLVDILLGSLTSTSISEAKIELAAYVRQRIGDGRRDIVSNPIEILPTDLCTTTYSR